MEITIKGEPKEIAALVVAIQERRDSEIINVSGAMVNICDQLQPNRDKE